MNFSTNTGLFLYTNPYGHVDWRIVWGGSIDQTRQMVTDRRDIDLNKPSVYLAAREGESYEPVQTEFLWALNRSPWADETFWTQSWDRWVLHLPAMSVKHPGRLSYFQSEEKRSRDIRTPIKPGRYLKKFFADVLSEDQIQTLGIAWEAAATAPKLHVTSDADEIETIYVKGPHSCMAYTASNFAAG